MSNLSQRELDAIYKIVDDALAAADPDILQKLETLPMAHRLVGYQFVARWHEREDDFQKAAIQGFVRAADETAAPLSRRKIYRETLNFLRNTTDKLKRPQGAFQKICATKIESLTPPSAVTPAPTAEKKDADQSLRPLKRGVENLRLVA